MNLASTTTEASCKTQLRLLGHHFPHDKKEWHFQPFVCRGPQFYFLPRANKTLVTDLSKGKMKTKICKQGLKNINGVLEWNRTFVVLVFPVEN